MSALSRIAGELTPDVQRAMFECLQKSQTDVQSYLGSFVSVALCKVRGPSYSAVAVGGLAVASSWYFSDGINEKLSELIEGVQGISRKHDEAQKRFSGFLDDRKEEVARLFSAVDTALHLKGELYRLNEKLAKVSDEQKEAIFQHREAIKSLEEKLEAQKETIFGFKTLILEIEERLQKALRKREVISQEIQERLGKVKGYYNALIEETKS